MKRNSPVKTFTFKPDSIETIERFSTHCGGNKSKALNTYILILAGVVSDVYCQNIGARMRIEIIPVGGSPVPMFEHGDGYVYAETPKTGAYSIKLYNDSGVRVEVVLTVDGLDTVSGSSASILNQGWLVPAFDSIILHGWSCSTSEAVPFAFPGFDNGTGLVGTIALAVFTEKISTSVLPPSHTQSSDKVPKQNAQTAATTNLPKTPFSRFSIEPVRTVLLRYASREQLLAWNVPVDHRSPPPVRDPFARAAGSPCIPAK